jgi:hypothetical protein
MNQRLITVRERDNRALADVEGMRQDLREENAALRREIAHLRMLLRMEENHPGVRRAAVELVQGKRS